MRSSAQACEDLLARLFTDVEFRARFIRDPQGVGREFDLDEAALATLARTDWVGLELAARSYSHKRETYAGRKRRWWRLLVLSVCVLMTGLAQSGEAVFDTHVHLRDGEASLLKFESEVRASGIELAGVGAMWFGGPHQAAAGDLAKIRAGNDGLIALAAKHPVVAPIGTVHPYDGRAALDELARIAARGVRTLKIHPHTQRFVISDPRVLALVTKAGELGVAVLMDNAGIVAGDCEDLFNLAAKAPKTRFIFAHMGGANFRFWNILVLARTADGFALDNVNFDISGTVLLAADTPIEKEFVWTLRNVGVEHVMLGSDYPQISLARMVEAMEKLDLTSEEKTAILSGNARRILGAAGKKN